VTAGEFPTIVASEFSGITSNSPLDQTSTATDDTVTSHSSGSTATTAQADELLVGSYGTGSSTSVYTATGSFILPTNGQQGDNTTNIAAQIYSIVSATGTYAATLSTDPDSPAASSMGIGTYRAASGGGGGVTKPMWPMPFL
jgi:hypothetical protein